MYVHFMANSPGACLTLINPVILGLALTGSITQFTKVTVGRPRPGMYFPSQRLTLY